jgi:hypothetical protein
MGLVIGYITSFSNISVLSWQPVLLVEETGISREKKSDFFLTSISFICIEHT